MPLTSRASRTLCRLTSLPIWSPQKIDNPTQLFTRRLRVAENFFKPLVRNPIKPQAPKVQVRVGLYVAVVD
jgi:hypothetical protein